MKYSVHTAVSVCFLVLHSWCVPLLKCCPVQATQHPPPKAAKVLVADAGYEKVNGYYAIDPDLPTYNGTKRWSKLKEDGSFYKIFEQGWSVMNYSTLRNVWNLSSMHESAWVDHYVVAAGETSRPPTDGWVSCHKSGLGPYPKLKWIGILITYPREKAISKAVRFYCLWHILSA